jgi:UDP-glucose 4-epimerase
MSRADIANRFSGAEVLITGGLGFIGSNLAHVLVDGGANVVLADSLIEQYGGNRHNVKGLEGRLQVNSSDVRDEYSLRQLVRGCDIVFNLAGQTSHLDSMKDPYTDLEINARSQLSILEACRHENPVARVVFASTRQIYGRPERLPVSETHPIAPIDVDQ